MTHYVSNIPTKEEKARNHTRIPRSFSYQKWSQCTQGTSSKRSQTPHHGIVFRGYCMIPQKNRVSRKEFPSYKEMGTRSFSPLFSVVFYKNKDILVKESKVSVVVSKKTAKTAVVRNRLRRRFYDLFQPYLNVLNSVTTIVVYPKKEAEKAKFSVLQKEVEKTLKQTKVIKG